MKRIFLFLSAALLSFGAILTSCSGKTGSSSTDRPDGDTIPLRYATNLTMVRHDGYVEATIRNPWDTTKTLHKYILTEKDKPQPSDLPEGTVIRLPLENALVYSTVHTGLLQNLGAVDAIRGVCNPEYVRDPELKKRVEDGQIVDCGNSMAPDLERVIMLHPEAILLSPYENNNQYGKVGEMGIPIVECADYMENSPLARAEWMKFYGLLTGKEAEADSLFTLTESRYNQLKTMASKTSNRPKILMDSKYEQAWNVPAGLSTMGLFIKDAGGVNPFARFERTGSVALSPEQVLKDAHDADIWLVRYNQPSEKTLKEFGSDVGINTQFEAYKNGNVFGCNAAHVGIFEEIPFHPDWLLEDFISIFHPELGVEPTHKYFTRLK